MFVSLGYTNIPFGDSSLRTFSKKRYRYVGREKDLESGLYYYGARYYCAWTCRFISVDPLVTKYAQLSPYNNADNNPVNDYDIDGMQDTGSEETPQSGKDTITIQKTIYLQSAIDEEGNPVFDNSQLADYGNYAINNLSDVYGNKDVNFKGKQYTTDANFNYIVLLPGESIELGNNDVLWTIKNQGESFAAGNTASMNYNDRGNTAAHEMGHQLGLSDRYHYIQKVNKAAISEDFSTHPMALNPKVDPEYFGNEFSNLMSNGGPDLTSMQWDIILSNKTEQEYKQVTFFMTGAENVNPSKYPALAPIGERGMSYYKLPGKDKYGLKGSFQGIIGYYNPFTKEASNTSVEYLFNHPNPTPVWKKNTENNPERSLIPYTR